MLKAVADALSAMPGALLARYGGDEFVALFIGVEREQAFLRLEKVREALAALEAVSVDGKSEALRLSISVGAAAYPIDGTGEAVLLREALDDLLVKYIHGFRRDR